MPSLPRLVRRRHLSWLVLLTASLLASAGRAATVRLLSPLDGDRVLPGETTLVVQVRLGPGESLQRLAARVDGTAVDGRSIVVDDSDQAAPIRRLRIPLGPGSHRVEVVAETDRAPSPPVSLQLQVEPIGGGGGPDADPLLRPRLYVLAIGVSQYRDPALQLRFPAKDATDLAQALKRQAGGLYRDVEVRLLTDGWARKAAILDGLDWLQHQTTGRDVAAVFLAGHGIRDGATGIYYFLPADADLDAVKRTMISQADLQASLRSLPGKVLVFLDTCFAGQLMRSQERAAPPDIGRFVQELVSADSGVVVFASSSGRQTSQESPAWRNGAFTRALVEGLAGRAALPGRGSITLSMLDLYVSERVKQLTGGVQTPTLARPQSIPDFPIALPLGEEPPAVAAPPPPPVAAPAAGPPTLATMKRDVMLNRYRRDRLSVFIDGGDYVVLRGEDRVEVDKPEFFRLLGRDELGRRLADRGAVRRALYIGGGITAGLALALGIGTLALYIQSDPLKSGSGGVGNNVIGLGVAAVVMTVTSPILFVAGAVQNLQPITPEQARGLADDYNQRLLRR